MECYILNDACDTSSVKDLSSICYSMDVFFCHSSRSSSITLRVVVALLFYFSHARSTNIAAGACRLSSTTAAANTTEPTSSIAAVAAAASVAKPRDVWPPPTATAESILYIRYRFH